MRDYVIFADASADVDFHRISREALHFVPMEYSIGEEQRVTEGPERDELLRAFYAAQREGVHTQTSQITPQHYKEAFRPYLEQDVSVLYLSLSSGLTKTFDSANITSKELNGRYGDAVIRPVDTLSATTGIGLLIERALQNQQAGLSLEENAVDIEQARNRVCHLFMVADLMYLKRGGRISATSAVMGTMLNVKPILVILPDGTLTSVTKKRGEKKAMREMLERYAAARDPEQYCVYLAHADAQAHAEHLGELARELDPRVEPSPLLLCPVIGAHTGPDMCSVVFWGDRNAICAED